MTIIKKSNGYWYILRRGKSYGRYHSYAYAYWVGSRMSIIDP